MKILYFSISVTTFLFFLSSCGSGESDKEKIKKELKEELLQEMQADKQAENNQKKEAETNKTNTKAEQENFEITNIKNGDIIEGLEVIKKEYQPGVFFNIELKGQKKIGGNVVYDEFEDAWMVKVDEQEIPKSRIIINGKEHLFYNSIIVRNRDDFKRALGGESVDMVKNGQGVWVKFKYENFSIGQHFDKGRIGVAYVDYTTGR